MRVDTTLAENGCAWILNNVRSEKVGKATTHSIVSVIESKRVAISEPIIERDGGFPKIILLEHILVPYHELYYA